MADETWRNCEGTWDRLRWARINYGFETAKDAAAALGMKEGTYRSYERRPDSSKHTPLDHQVAATFATKYRVNWLWLLLGQGGPFDRLLTPAQERILAATSTASTEDQERVAAAVEALLGRTGTRG
jgi:hypothetical protein